MPQQQSRVYDCKSRECHGLCPPFSFVKAEIVYEEKPETLEVSKTASINGSRIMKEGHNTLKFRVHELESQLIRANQAVASGFSAECEQLRCLFSNKGMAIHYGQSTFHRMEKLLLQLRFSGRQNILYDGPGSTGADFLVASATKAPVRNGKAPAPEKVGAKPVGFFAWALQLFGSFLRPFISAAFRLLRLPVRSCFGFLFDRTL